MRGLPGKQRAGAESPRALARTGLPIDPVLVVHALCERPKRRVGPGKRSLYKGFAPVPGEGLLVGEREGRAQVVPGDAVRVQGPGLEAEDAPGEIEFGKDGFEHRVQGLLRDGGLEKGDVQEVGNVPVAVQGQARARDGIDRGCGHVFDGLPGGVSAFKGRPADAAVRVFHQRPAL